MNVLFKPKYLKNSMIILSIVLGIKIVWFALSLLFLSSSSIDYIEKRTSKPLYYHVNFVSTHSSVPSIKKTKPVLRINGGKVKDIHLLAIYHDRDMSVVTVEYRHATKVLSNGDAIDGFVLQDAGNNYAIFAKDDKNYKVSLIHSIDDNVKHTAFASVVPIGKKKSRQTNTLGKIIDAGDHKIIDRSLLQHYANNINDVYKNIGIGEIKKGTDVVGFRINFVRRDSPFAQLGVRRGDIIKSINGESIDSYSAAFSVYKNIKNMDNVNLVIQRGEEEMELEYEVN